MEPSSFIKFVRRHKGEHLSFINLKRYFAREVEKDDYYRGDRKKVLAAVFRIVSA
jgi:hypothetical protein